MYIQVKYSKPIKPGDEAIKLLAELKQKCASAMEIEEDEVDLVPFGWEDGNFLILEMEEGQYQALRESGSPVEIV